MAFTLIQGVSAVLLLAIFLTTNVGKTQAEEQYETPCVDTYEERIDTNALGAKQAPYIYTRDDCIAECQYKTYAECAGFDFNSVNPSCWIHTPATIKNVNPNPAPGVDLYIRHRCGTTPCVDTFEEHIDTIAYGHQARQAQGITTREGCEAQCLSQTREECAGFDFNFQNYECWIHTEDTIVNVNPWEPYINLYIRQNCNGTCADGFDKTPHTHAMGGSEAPGIITIGDCATECLSRTDVECAGFDFNKYAYPPCRIHTSATINNIQVLYDVDLYTRQACINGVAATQDPCDVDGPSRRNCGFFGITEQECEDMDCCYEEGAEYYAWCFHKE